MSNNKKKSKSATRSQVGANNKIVFSRYIKYLRYGLERKEKTIIKVEYALGYLEKLMPRFNVKDRLTQESIIDFKEKLRDCEHKSKPLGPGTRYDILRHIKNFYHWLAQQPGFRSKVKNTDLVYFKANDEERNYRICREMTEYPTLEQVVNLCKSIKIGSIIDERDRALFAYIFLTGARIDAVASLSIECLDPKRMVVDQNPRKGVRTKFSRQIKTVLFPLDDYLMEIIIKWYWTLRKRNYGYHDPLFPRAEMATDGYAYVESHELSHEPMSSGGIRQIFKRRYEEAGMKYQRPHSYRHGCISEAINRAEGGQDMKAISQNLGHLHVGYIFNVYGQLTEKNLADCIKNLKRPR